MSVSGRGNLQSMTSERRSIGLRNRRRKWRRDQIRVTDRATMRRSIEGTAIGNFMEWYDFGVYGYIATTIAQVFYPGNSVSAVHLIATFSTLAAAFVVRPLGGFIFGPLGDRIGRRRVLMITITLMTVGTTGTGLLPGYHTIGIWAPILLVVARIFQGLSTGGEYVGAMTYVVEQAPDRKRGMMVGFLPLGNLSGFVAAGLLVTGLQSLAAQPRHADLGLANSATAGRAVRCGRDNHAAAARRITCLPERRRPGGFGG